MEGALQGEGRGGGGGFDAGRRSWRVRRTSREGPDFATIISITTACEDLGVLTLRGGIGNGGG